MTVFCVLRCLFSRAKPVWSTAKDVLEKLRPLHPLPGIILEWRRLTAALAKVVFPLQRGRTYCKALTMDRMHCIVDTFTATGRVTMHEPNLQNVPKDFVIDIPCKKLSNIFHYSAISILTAVLPWFLGGLFWVDLIKWVSNVHPPVRPQNVSSISMKFVM